MRPWRSSWWWRHFNAPTPTSGCACWRSRSPSCSDLAFFFSGIRFRPSIMWLTSMARGGDLPVRHVDTHPFRLRTAVARPDGRCGRGVEFAADGRAGHRRQQRWCSSPPPSCTGSTAVAIYLPVLGMGWLVGFLMQTQRRLMIKQEEAQAALAEHAVGDERRRIAREVHDVIAHSLSVTMLHVTGARRALQQDRDIDDAVDALEDAERLGRQAMADIRRTVGLLDGSPSPLYAPRRNPMSMTSRSWSMISSGQASRFGYTSTDRRERVSAAAGLALYRIAQESLANIAKHAPESKPVVTLHITRSTAELSVVNQLPVAVSADRPRRAVVCTGCVNASNCSAAQSMSARPGTPGRCVPRSRCTTAVRRGSVVQCLTWTPGRSPSSWSTIRNWCGPGLRRILRRKDGFVDRRRMRRRRRGARRGGAAPARRRGDGPADEARRTASRRPAGWVRTVRRCSP